MAIKTITVEVTHTVEVTLDESKFTPEFMTEFREHFYQYRSLEEHARHLAFLYATDMVPDSSGFIEGYGQQEEMGIKMETIGHVETNCVRR